MIAEFLDSTGGLAVKGALVAAFLDLAFGIFAAVKDGTFAIDAVAAFLRKHLVGRVLPLSCLAVAAHYSGDPVMLSTAAAGLVAYAAETLGSIYGSLNPPAASVTQEHEVAVEVNPIPQD
jgi:hypothetical protein